MMIWQVAGAAVLLIAFAALQAGKTTEKSDFYLLANIGGSACLAAISWITGQWGFAVLNSVWWAVSVRSAWSRDI